MVDLTLFPLALYLCVELIEEPAYFEGLEIRERDFVS